MMTKAISINGCLTDETTNEASPFSFPACIPMNAIDLTLEKGDILLGNEHRAFLEVDRKKRFHHGYAEFWCEPSEGSSER